jgi:hypothetical protein
MEYENEEGYGGEQLPDEDEHFENQQNYADEDDQGDIDINNQIDTDLELKKKIVLYYHELVI